jgi:DNA-binding SARP family transcriptional activator
MSELIVRLLGGFTVCAGEQRLAGLQIHKVQELFAYLLLNRGRPLARTVLADLIWSDRPTAQARKNLRHTLWQLQGALGAHLGPQGAADLRAQPDWLELRPSEALWLDVAVLEQAHALAERVPAGRLDPPTVELLTAAVRQYQGELLEGWYQDWCLGERERIRGLYLAVLDRLMAYCETHHAYEAGLQFGARSLSCDRAAERTHRRLMRLHYLAGDRTAALRQYERCAAALQEELGVQPGRRTETLYQQIQADRIEAALVSPPADDHAVDESPPPLPEVLGRLEQLRSILADLQCQLKRDTPVPGPA